MLRHALDHAGRPGRPRKGVPHALSIHRRGRCQHRRARAGRAPGRSLSAPGARPAGRGRHTGHGDPDADPRPASRAGRDSRVRPDEPGLPALPEPGCGPGSVRRTTRADHPGNQVGTHRRLRCGQNRRDRQPPADHRHRRGHAPGVQCQSCRDGRLRCSRAVRVLGPGTGCGRRRCPGRDRAEPAGGRTDEPAQLPRRARHQHRADGRGNAGDGGRLRRAAVGGRRRRWGLVRVGVGRTARPCTAGTLAARPGVAAAVRLYRATAADAVRAGRRRYRGRADGGDRRRLQRVQHPRRRESHLHTHRGRAATGRPLPGPHVPGGSAPRG